MFQNFDNFLKTFVSAKNQLDKMTGIMEAPQCLIDSGEDGELVVNERVLDQLKRLDKQVVVVGIAGPYRTGKSYLMNNNELNNKNAYAGPHTAVG